MSEAQRARLDELTSAQLRRELTPREEDDLEALTRAMTADAYVTAGDGPPRAATVLNGAGREADQRIGRLSNAIIGRELKRKRGH